MAAASAGLLHIVMVVVILLMLMEIKVGARGGVKGKDHKRKEDDIYVMGLVVLIVLG